MKIYKAHKEDLEQDEKMCHFSEKLEEKRMADRLRVLLLGSGGRESAMAWRIALSPILEHLFIAPGNGGMEAYGESVPSLKANDFEAVAEFISKHGINLLVVGSEEALVKGIADYFETRQEDFPNLLVVGPNADGAILEGSKDFSKSFMNRHRIPTASYRSFAPTEKEEAVQFLQSLKAPYVLKADGLAAGKGVLIVDTMEEATLAFQELAEGSFGQKGQKIVIEEFLQGIECSVFVATDGKDYKILPVAKDYKRIGDGDTGPNTGGMGSVSPVPFADEIFMQKVKDRIIEPTIKGLSQEGIHYKGFIFIGLMNVEGNPFVIEYNCRLGDPETEVVMLRLKSDFLQMLKNIAEENLKDYILEEDPRSAVCVMLVSQGYPSSYIKGYEMNVLEAPLFSHFFHAGTMREDGKLVTSGGRVVAISSYGMTIEEARERSYSAIDLISFEGKNFRKDIALDLIKK